VTQGNIEQSAIGMIRNFGPGAAALADQMAGKYAQSGHDDGRATWRDIAGAIRRKMSPGAGSCAGPNKG
jgi:hypothetical protein